MNGQIRRAQIADTHAIARILRSLGWFAHLNSESHETTSERIAYHLNLCNADSSHSVYVAENSAGDVVGYGAVHWMPTLFLEGPEGYVSELFVEESASGQGAGTRLLEAMQAEATERGCSRLIVLNRRHRASYKRGFYRKLGWKERKDAANFIYPLSQPKPTIRRRTMLQTPIPAIEERFLSGFTWWDYVAHMKVNRQRVSQLFEEITLSPDDWQDFAAIVAKHGGQLYVTALTEDWCGDAAVNLPLIARLAVEVPGVDLRLFIRSDNPDLAQACAQVGITRIPVISFFNSSWHQVGQWVERPAAAQRRVEAWNAVHPQVETLRQSNQPQDRRAYRALLKERLIEMMDWYREDLWEATLTELKSLLCA